MRNEEVNKIIEKSGLYKYEIAEILGVSESTICRWFRKELPDSTKKKIIEICNTYCK